MRLFIKDCGNCPVLYQNSEHPESFCKLNHRRFFGAYQKGEPAPDWCPLRNGDITLEFKGQPGPGRRKPEGYREPKRQP
jgi:hypothetical protein